MEAIILAGGLGTRLREAVPDVPKPMADIGGRPFLSYLMDYAASQGIERVLLSVGYHHEAIRDRFGPRYAGMSLDYVIEHEPLGTGGAVRSALTRAGEDHVFVINGDTFFAIDYRRLREHHRTTVSDITLALVSVSDAARYGTVSVGADGTIVGFSSSGVSLPGIVNGGIYVLRRDVRKLLDAYSGAFSLEKDFFPHAVTALHAGAYISSDFFVDIGIPTDYMKAREILPAMTKKAM